MANYIININKQLPEGPSQVGDNSSTLNYGETKVFTVANLTTELVPAYTHPQGNPAAYLRIDALATPGELQLNGVPVTLNQIITFTDIASGLFTYVPDLAETDGVVEGFQFSIADESLIFVG